MNTCCRRDCQPSVSYAKEGWGWLRSDTSWKISATNPRTEGGILCFAASRVCGGGRMIKKDKELGKSESNEKRKKE